VKSVVLDSGFLIALERRDGRALALAVTLAGGQQTAFVTAGVVAQVWRGAARQHAVIRLLRTGAVQIEPMTEDVALRIGLLMAATGTSDVVDAHVALLAQKVNGVVVTSDPDDLKRIDAKLDVLTI
jgi:predicted nucleic acid-binding protein